MSDEIQQFTFQGQQLRTLADQHGEPWFIGKDVCDILGISNNRDAMEQLDDEKKYRRHRRPNPLAQGRRRPDRGRAGIGSGFGQLRYFDSSCSGVIPHAVHSDPRSPRVHSLLSWIRSFT